MLIYVGSRARNFRGIHVSWILVHNHRVGGENTAAAWVGIGSTFGNPSTEAILSYGFTGTLDTIWYITSKLKTVGVATSQELLVKYIKGDKERVSTGEFIPHKDPLCLIEGPDRPCSPY